MKKLLFILSLFCAFQWVKAAKGDPCEIKKTITVFGKEVTQTEKGLLDDNWKCVVTSPTTTSGNTLG